MLTRLFGVWTRVIDAGSALAESLEGLAATFREANGQVRDRLGLPAPVPVVEQLPEPASPGRRAKAK
ncbi:MAG: hypothetical protein U0797_26235 [Gemmataceae bacterium]